MKVDISIDPGFGGTGYAVWEHGKFKQQMGEPILTGTIKPRDSDTVDGALEIVDKLWSELNRYEFRRVGIEFPKLFGGSAVSMASAQSGDLFKLVYLIGTLGNTFRGASVELIPVNTWKGQLTKDVCERRIRGRLGWERKTDIDNHCWDAIGIGLWMSGRFE